MRSEECGKHSSAAPEEILAAGPAASPGRTTVRGARVAIRYCGLRLAGGTMPFIRRYSTIWP